MDFLFYKGEGPVWGQPAIIWAALTLALLTLPVVIVSTEEALQTIPRELKEASYALGATKLQTIIRIMQINLFERKQLKELYEFRTSKPPNRRLTNQVSFLTGHS